MEKENRGNIAFIVELFMMFAILILVIVVITETFVMTRSKSLRAKELTEAVITAENAAEITLASKDAEDAVRLLSEMENAEDVALDDGVVTLSVKQGNKVYPVTVSIDKKDVKTGTYTSGTVKVFHPGSTSGEPVYELDAGNYEKGAGK